MLEERFKKWELDALWARNETSFDTVRFFRNAVEIIGLYDVWKDLDRFYFIPLKLKFDYYFGHAIIMTGDEIYLGSFVRCIMEHEERYRPQCPVCGRKVYPYGFTDSGLYLEALCTCGWHDKVKIGRDGLWRGLFNAVQRADKKRLKRVRFFHPRFKAATIEELMDYFCQV